MSSDQRIELWRKNAQGELPADVARTLALTVNDAQPVSREIPFTALAFSGNDINHPKVAAILDNTVTPYEGI